MPPKFSTTGPGTKRNRHQPEQLEKLHALYAIDQHPALELRTSLGREIGMETKTVSAWFQNKRASTKKRIRIPRGRNAPAASVAPTTSAMDEDEYEDGDYLPADSPAPRYTAPKPESSHSMTPDAEVMPQRARVVHSEQQVLELQRLWKITTHPTTSQRQDLAERIGMRPKSVTNYFQNRRSSEKKRRDDDEKAAALMNARSSSSSSAPPMSHHHYLPPSLPPPPPPPPAPPILRGYSAFPPASTHPSLGMVHPSVHQRQREETRSPSPSSMSASPRESISRRPSPYGSISSLSRPRRSRLEPYQLDALKAMWAETANPSIEARTSLGMEIGMDLGKITNWFRNCRQKGVKSSSRTDSQFGYDDDEDMDMDDDSLEHSPRPGSPHSRYSHDQDDLMSESAAAPEDEELYRRHFIGPKETNKDEALPPILRDSIAIARWNPHHSASAPPHYYRHEAITSSYCEPPRIQLDPEPQQHRPRDAEQAYYIEGRVHQHVHADIPATGQFGEHYSTNSPQEPRQRPVEKASEPRASPRAKLDDALLLLSFHLHPTPRPESPTLSHTD